MALSIKDAKKGDYVQYIGYEDFKDTNAFTIGKYYQLRADYKDKCYLKAPWAHIDSGYLAFELDDKGSTTNGWGAGLFTLVATKPDRQAEQDFLASLDYTEKTQPTIRRNLAFYKRSGLPWTQEEYLKILFYTEGKTETIHLTPKNKFIYDYGTTNSFQYDWCQQENHSNFALCKQIAYEDVFPSKRIAVVTRSIYGHPVGSRIVKTTPNSDTLWRLADNSSNREYAHAIGRSCEWEDELDIVNYAISLLDTTLEQRLRLKKVLEANDQTFYKDSTVLTSSNIGSNTTLGKSSQGYWIGTDRDANISLEAFITLFNKSPIFVNPCSEIPISIPAPQIKPTQKEITMPTTIQQILSRLFGLEKPTTDYENRAAYIVVAYNRDGSEMGTATAASLKIIKDKVAATPELWGCKVLAYKLEKEVSVTVPVKATDITVHVPVAEESAEK